MHGLFAVLASYIKPYIFQISFVIVTCALVVAEAYLHGSVKRLIRKYHFVIRVTIYVIMFAFVYSLLVTFLGPRVARVLYTLSDGMLLVSLTVIFVVLGVLIERK